MKTRQIVVMMLVLAATGTVRAVPGKVSAVFEKNAVAVSVDGKIFCKYQYKNRYGKKPYIYPLVGPLSGKSVTAESPRQYPQNNSLWFGCAQINGVDFWHHQVPGGKEISQPPEMLRASGERVVFEAVCDWKSGVAKTLMRDYRRIAVSAPDSKTRIIDFNIVWVALDNINIKHNNDSLFALQVAEPLSVKGGGKLLNADGADGEKGTFGKKSQWIDCSGMLDGVKEGVALMPHPDSRWYPSPWFTRSCGFVSPTPIFKIGNRGMRLNKGEAVHLAYRVIVHAGDADEAAIAHRFKLYAEVPPEPVRMYIRHVLADELPDVARYKWGKSRRALLNVRDVVQSVATIPALRARLEAALIRTLVLVDVTADGKKFICQQLGVIGGDDSVDAITKLLSDPDEHVAEAAVCALASIGNPKAAAALVNGLKTVNGKTARESIVESLGHLRCTNAIATLARLVMAEDSDIAHVATIALGRIGGDRVVLILLKLWDKKHTDDIADAILIALDKSEVSAGVFEQGCRTVYDKTDDTNHRLASARLNAVKKGDASLLLKALASEGALKTGALSALRELPRDKAGSIIRGLLNKSDEKEKVLLLNMAADINPASCLDDARTAVQSERADVREAAYRIIGAGGDARDVDTLLKAAAGDTGAVHALVKLSGDDVTEILIKKLAAGSPETQRHIIEIMTERGDEAFAVPLLKLVGGDNRPVSLMAIKSLKRVGDVNTARKLVELLNDEKLASSYRRAMEASLANILLRFSGKLDISGFMTANYRKSDNSAKASLLRVMGSLQDNSTLKLIAGAAQNSNAEIRTAAVRSLTRWRSEAAIEPLMQVAGTGSSERDNALCLGAAARLLRASKRPQNELLPLYEKGRKLARRDEDRKLFEVKNK